MKRSFLVIPLSTVVLVACSGGSPGEPDARVALDTGGRTCGDGWWQPNEDCEPGNPLTVTCQDLGYVSGTLACALDCTFEVSGCRCEDCHNRLDDDGDGAVDCDDPDCLGVDGCPTEQCTDGIDNDGNGMADCADPGCASHTPGCNAGCLSSETQWIGYCGNGADDDCDGLPDAEDPDCLGQTALLLVERQDCGPLGPGDDITFALIVYADATDLPDVQVDLPLPAALEAVVLPDGGTYDATDHAVTWDVGPLAHGVAARLRVEGTVGLAAGWGATICTQALVQAGTLIVSDDPTTGDVDDVTCVTLAPRP